jgi:NAD(P)-dependent dehydrogenase (short-subunit alcohol dehydrogenase family)
MTGQPIVAAGGERFAGRVAIVTGAGSGIGRAVAWRLVAEGATVLGVDLDDSGLAGTASATGERMSTLRVDLADHHAAGEVVATCLDRYGRVDVLGNVAGVHGTGHAPEITVEQYRRVMAVNLDAPFFLAQAVIPYLLASSGNIVNVSSHAGLQGVPYAAAYSASKGGLIALTRSLAVEYLKRPLRVNAIAPAATNTPMAAAGRFPADVDRQLLGRLGGHRSMTEPEEVAALFAFLASDEARSVTGAVYTIDNGLTVS